MNEKAIEAAAQTLFDRECARCVARGNEPHHKPGTLVKNMPHSYRDDYEKDAQAMLTAALPHLPPLRAREEIAQAGIKEFVERQLKKLDAMEGEGASRIWCAGYRQALESVERVSGALSSTAGQEWRDISVPEGWQLVPKAPTEVMLEAVRGSQYWSRTAIYSAMLSAAPPEPALEGEWMREIRKAVRYYHEDLADSEHNPDAPGDAAISALKRIEKALPAPPVAEPLLAEKQTGAE